MAIWTSRDAKGKFSELVDTAEKEGAQVITRRGIETVVVVPIRQWNLLSAASRPTLKELLLQSHPRFDLDELLPPRRSQKHRDPPEFY